LAIAPAGRSTRLETDARLALTPNRTKAAISIIKTVLTTAMVRYTSLGEDGATFATFIDLPHVITKRIMMGPTQNPAAGDAAAALSIERSV